MWIQNHVQEKNKKKYPFLNKHQTCQDIYDLPVQSRTEAAILGHTAPGTYFSLFQSCVVMFFLVELSNSRQTLKGRGIRSRAQHVDTIDPSSMLMILIICNKSCKTFLYQRILTKLLGPKALFTLPEKIEFGVCKKFENLIFTDFSSSHILVCVHLQSTLALQTPRYNGHLDQTDSS